MNEFRSQSQMGGRVDYVKQEKPTFDLAKEARGQRAKMGGDAPGVQPPSPNKAPKSGKPEKKQFDPAKLGTKPSLKDTPKVEKELLEY